MRLLLVMWLTMGMAPGLGEVAETVVHLAMSGHIPHSDADQGDLGDQGKEHGCGTTQHTCGCCASQVAAASPPARLAAPLAPVRTWRPPSTSLCSLHEPSPLYRPPIAS